MSRESLGPYFRIFPLIRLECARDEPDGERKRCEDYRTLLFAKAYCRREEPRNLQMKIMSRNT